MSHTVQTAVTLNNLSSNVAHALDVQTGLNAQLKGGLMVVNQRIDLVQEQVDTLWQMAQLGCQWKYAGLCVTSNQYENYTRIANLSKQLSQYLLGNWTGEFDTMMEQLRISIVARNSTRVDAGLATGLSSWITAVMNHLKEWAGMAAMAALMCLAALVCLWYFCRLKKEHNYHKAMVYQALVAMDSGEEPSVWLTSLK